MSRSVDDLRPAAMDIPGARHAQELADQLHIIVGSPEQVDDGNLRSRQMRSPPSLDIPPRPSISRNISTATLPPTRGSGTHSRIHDLHSGAGSGSTLNHFKSREWSVFGELFDAEDRLRTSAPHLTEVRLRNHKRRHTTNPAAPYPPLQDQRYPSDTVQSPVEEPSLTEPSAESSEEGSLFHGSNSRPNAPSVTVNTSHFSSTHSRWRWPSLSALPPLSPLQRNILKCSVAYFVASLFTFSPYLSGFIADLTNYGPAESFPAPSGHMVATVAVYYNPAKTLGGMIEADMYCMMGLLFAAFISLSSMTMFWFFEVRAGWEWLADALVILWIGTGMSLVAWTKLWMAKPTFNTACSMTAIILFVVVIKEGGLQTLLQVSFIILCGATVSNLVCILLWPQRATKNLQKAMTQTLQSFSTLLEMLTDTFLLEDSLQNLTGDKLRKAAESHQASFTSLKKHFDEAQSEWLIGGPKKPRGDKTDNLRESSGQAYQDAIGCLNRLGQHLNGLRSGTTLQYELIKAEKDGKLVLRNRYPNTSGGTMPTGAASDSSATIREDEDAAMLQAAASMFGDLIDDLGPPLKALSTACITTLKRLKDGFTARKDPVNRMTSAEFQQLADAVRRALFTFESTSNHAVVRMYRRQQNMSGTQSRDSYGSALYENHVLMDNDGESVFLVYFFIFTLQEFSKELIALVDALERLYAAEHERASPRMKWKWLRDAISISGPRRASQNKRNERSFSKRFSVYFNPGPRRDPVAFPKIRPHAPNTMQTPARSNLSLIGRLKQSLWAIGARLREPDIKYAFKAGMATAMLAAPAFFDSTRPLFLHYRGEWALISFFVVISPTIGATNFMGVHRVLGTLFGAATAAGIWTLFPENPYALSIFGFFFSIPCFYYIVAKPQYATSSRFVLLTYNLTCLYCYNLRRKDVDVLEIAYHRAVAVTIGVIWAAIVSRYWWPTEARRALSKALGEFCLNMGWLYTRLVAFNSFADADLRAMQDDADDESEESPFMPQPRNAHLTNSIHHFMAMELHLQIKLIEIQGLLAQTQHEPRWKGPFPVALYRSILTSLQKILDQLHSMRCVTAREEWHTTVRRDFILPVNRERREMVGNIILYFSTLSAAFALKSPLPPYLPPAEEARLRLVDAIRKLDVVRNRDVRGSRQLLFFAYALTMKGVIQELNFLGHTLQDVFGVIGQSREEFEALFNVIDTPSDV